MRTKIVLLSVLVLTAAIANSQSIQCIQWQKSIGGSGYDEAKSICQTSDGGYIIAGKAASNDGDIIGYHGNNDAWIIKIDQNGLMIWSRVFGGTGYDDANSIQQTTDGGFIFVGSTTSMNGDIVGKVNESQDFWVVKLDASGVLQWQKILGGSTADGPASIYQTMDGGYVIAGHSSSNDIDVSGHHGIVGIADCWIIKISSAGTIEWQKSYGGSSYDYAQAIVQAADGSFLFTGSTMSNDFDVAGNHGNYDYWVVKLDVNGNLIWQKALGGSNADGSSSLALTTDGGCIVTGYSSSTNGDVTGNHGGTNDCWVVKLDALGAIEWENSYGGTGNEEFGSAIQQTPDGGYFIGGPSNSTDGDRLGNHGFTDIWVFKLNSGGSIISQRSLGGSSSELAWTIDQTTDGGLIISGYSYSTNGDVSINQGASDIWVVKLTAPAIATEFFRDADGDGYGDPLVSVLDCIAPNGYVNSNTDCDDSNFAVHPGATETCNGTDDDCDGLTDEIIIPAPGPVTGQHGMCNLPASASYTIPADPHASSYNWTVSSPAMSISSGQGTTSVVINYTNSFTAGEICVASIYNFCQGPPTCISVVKNKPQAPGVISGPNSGVCISTQTYSINPVSGASSHTWTVPGNTSIVSGQGTTSVTVAFAAGFSSGNISVKANNNCGNSAASPNLAVVAKPAASGLISGPVAGVCNSTQTYTVGVVEGASSYNWVVPSGAIIQSGQGTNSISVGFSSSFGSGTIKVNASNTCGISAYSPNLTVLGRPAVPQVIGDATPCIGAQETYTITPIPGATGYGWVVTGAGYSIVSGQNSTSVTIMIGNGNGSIKVRSSNSCGTSAYSPNLNLTPVSCFAKGGGANEKIFSDAVFDVQVFPNPSIADFRLVIRGNNKEKITVTISDVNGVKRAVYVMNEGDNQLKLGPEFNSGTYFAEVLQGEKRKVMKLVKLK